MRKIIIYFLLALHLPCFAINYFMDGVQWCESYVPATILAHGGVEWMNASPFECINSDQNDVMDLMRDGIVYAKLKTDADKIYFLDQENSGEWILFYDFSLKPGETCVVGMPNFPNNYHEIELYEVKCRRIVNSVEYDNYPVMEFDLYSDFEGEKINIASGQWLIGIGSTMGVMYNVGCMLDGIAHRLDSAYFNGEMLCARSSSGISNVIQPINNDDILYDIHGCNIINPGKGNLYIKNRKKIIY